MKIAITTNEIFIPKKLFSAKVDKELEFDSALPDYCPDIARLVKVDCTPFLENCDTEGEKATIKGKVLYDVLYETDYKNRLRCVSFTQEFSQSIPIPRSNAEDITAFCDTECSKISCKLLSPRRVIIKSTLGTQFDIEGETAIKAVAVNESKNEFFRKKTIGFEGRTSLHSENFHFSDSLSLAQSEKSIGEIVCGSITLQPAQTTISPGRAEIKTTAAIHILCEEENNEGVYYMSQKTLPVNIDYQNDAIEDFKHISLSLEPRDFEFSPELDQYGESRVIKTSFNVKIKMKINEPKAYTVADDMFEKGYNSILQKGTAKMPILYSQSESGFTIETKLPSMTPRPDTILDSSAKDFGSSTEKTEGGINLSGSFILTLMTNTPEGIFSFDHSVPYKQFCPLDLPEGESNIVADTYPIEAIATLHSDGSATVRIIAGTKLYVFTESEDSFIQDVTKRTPIENTNEGSMLVYFYPNKTDDLWSIAKNYRTDPESILSSNPQHFDENGNNTEPERPILIKS